MQPQFDTLARSLADAWNACSTIPLPPIEAAPRSRADALPPATTELSRRRRCAGDRMRRGCGVCST